MVHCAALQTEAPRLPTHTHIQKKECALVVAHEKPDDEASE